MDLNRSRPLPHDVEEESEPQLDIAGAYHALELLRPSEAPRISELIRTLLSPATLPHILLLLVGSIAFHLLAMTEAGRGWGVAGFISVGLANIAVAVLHRSDRFHHWVRVQAAPESATLGAKLATLPLRILRIWLPPLVLAAPIVAVMAWFLSNGSPDRVGTVALALASMFIIWSAAQAFSLSTWIDALARQGMPEEGGDRTYNPALSIGVHTVLLLVLASLCAWGLGLGGQSLGEVEATKLVSYAAFLLVLLASQAFLFWRHKDHRAELGKRTMTASRSWRWTFLMQAFIAWHLLSAWRRFGGDVGPGAIIEELVLMLATIISAIWALAAAGVRRNSRLFTAENALFWGLAFGYGYAGSVSMIAVLTDDIFAGIPFLSGGVSGAIGVGHLVTLAALAWLHRRGLYGMTWKEESVETDLDDVEEEEAFEEIDFED